MKMQGAIQYVFKLVSIGLLAAVVLSACAGEGTGRTTPANTPAALATAPGAAEATPQPDMPEPTATQVAAVDTTEPASEPTAQTPEATAAPVDNGGARPAPEVPADSATTFPDPTNFTWAEFASGLSQPLDLTSFPDGSGRILILEQPGSARIYQDGRLLPEPFLNIRHRVTTQGTEQGLLGLAFHPNFAENGYFYVNYTGRQGIGDTFISRFQISPDDPNRADPDSEVVLLQFTQPYRNHNGGGMVFGPDGYLYISTGDGGSGGDPHNNGQSLDTLLGKLLRIDVDGGEPYAIPPDNPFVNGGGLPEIWAYGLRNPWRFAFDRLTGDLYIADVGQNQWEEINFQPADSPGGENYGWVYREGANPFQGTPPAELELVDPVFEYRHGLGCSITGGFVYRGQALPEFRGIYIFSDFCSGRVWGLLRGADGWQGEELFGTGLNVSSFGEDADGEIYLMDRSSGKVFKLQRNQ